MKDLNLILILIDSGRQDYMIKSEMIERLRSKFSFFTNVITYAPHTIASMHAIFSGCYGNRTGTNSYWSTFKFKKNKFKTLAEYLYELGFKTYADVHSDIVSPKQGFNQFRIYDEETVDITTRHCDLLNEISNERKKFFVYLHYSKIHTGIKNEVLKKYTNFSEDYYKNLKLNEERYERLFHESENYLNKILETICSLELEKNSIILIMSDHGISIGEKMGEIAYGAFCYDYTLKTLSLIKFPEITPIQINQQIRSIDMMPTILDILDIQVDKQFDELDGRTLMPLILGNNMDEEIAYSETGNPLNEKRPPKEPNTMSVRTSKWKFIHNAHNNTKELYDLENDPSETKNLFGTNLDIENYLWEKLENIRNNF